MQRYLTEPGTFVSENQTFEYTGVPLITGKKGTVEGLVLGVLENNGSKFLDAIYEQNGELKKASFTGDGMPADTSDEQLVNIADYLLANGGYDTPDAYYIVLHSTGTANPAAIYEAAFGEPWKP